MVWWMIPILLIVLSIVIGSFDSEEDSVVFFAGAGFLCGIILICVGIGMSVTVIKCSHGIDECDRNVIIAQSQYETQIALLEDYIDKFPLETEMITKLEPALLLKLPEIKSNTLLLEICKQAVDIKNIEYEWKYSKSEYQKRLDVYQHWMFIPKFVSAKYNKGSE